MLTALPIRAYLNVNKSSASSEIYLARRRSISFASQMIYLLVLSPGFRFGDKVSVSICLMH
jgi:hypothetical protein